MPQLCGGLCSALQKIVSGIRQACLLACRVKPCKCPHVARRPRLSSTRTALPVDRSMVCGLTSSTFARTPVIECIALSIFHAGRVVARFIGNLLSNLNPHGQLSSSRGDPLRSCNEALRRPLSAMPSDLDGKTPPRMIRCIRTPHDPAHARGCSSAGHGESSKVARSRGSAAAAWLAASVVLPCPPGGTGSALGSRHSTKNGLPDVHAVSAHALTA